MVIKTSAEHLIGNTPLLRLKNFEKEEGISAKVFAKLEYLNPSGSVKDRVAKAIIDDAEKSGKLKKGSVIIEPTSGNTGIAIAAIAAAKGYKAIIVMPETMSEERRNIIKAYGAQIVLTEGALGMSGAIEKAEQIKKENKGSIIAGQFTNPANPRAHFESTGPEIWDDTDGNVDMFIAGVGTGGTLSGTGEYLKKQNENIKVIAVEPENSPVLSAGKSGKHAIQGIGAGFVPQTLNTEIYDEVITIGDDDAVSYAKKLAKTEGVLVGISAGAALKAASVAGKRSENAGKNIVLILPDSADRYYSTELFK